MTTIAIAGAGGQLGRRVAELALERGAQPEQLVLVSRSPDGLASFAQRGVQVRAGDFDAPATLAGAFKGVDRLLLISTNAIGLRTAQHLAAIAAAKEAGVRHIVYTSLPNASDDHPTGPLAADHHATEQGMRESGLAWTFLRNSLYADLQVPGGAQAVASGQLVTNAGDGRAAYVTREDCAAVAAAVLTSEGHEGRAYDVTGPELLTQDDVAAALASAARRPVEVVQVDDATLVQGMVAAGLPEEVAGVYAGFGRAIREGLLDVRTDVVATLAGRPPQRLADVFAAHREELVAPA